MREKAWRLGYEFNSKAWEIWDSLEPEEREAAEQRYEHNSNKNSCRVIYTEN
jgi:hypothetical protein